PTGMGFVLKRIAEEAEEDTNLIRYLQSTGLMPGSEFSVGEVSPSFGVILQRPGQTITVSQEIAAMIWGEVM
ncbi:MAG: ferrous iron transport protein A, partial [Oscillochloris sp.]|nr:ferrous iron transport protein A [Oscillochloris sp.]